MNANSIVSRVTLLGQDADLVADRGAGSGLVTHRGRLVRHRREW